jgi:membrane associated rhomboid family serine protease
MSPLLRRLYLANAAVLLVHQMDAAYWHEWTLFRLPGGLALYLVLNVPIALAIVAGYGAIVAGRTSAVAYAWLVAASGLFAAGFHAWHLAAATRRSGRRRRSRSWPTRRCSPSRRPRCWSATTAGPPARAVAT